MMCGPLLLTRPRTASRRFAAICRDRFGPDLEIVIAPVFDIVPREVRLDLNGIGGLIFTSLNGVACFAKLGLRPDVPAHCVGARTAEAAARAGLRTGIVMPDAARLIAEILARVPDAPLLHLHGAHVTGDLSGDLFRGGLPAREVVIYDQRARPLSAAGRDVLARPGPVFLPLFSARTACLMAEALLSAQAALHIAAISPAVAGAIDLPRGAKLAVAADPDTPGMLAALSNLMKRGSILEP